MDEKLSSSTLLPVTSAVVPDTQHKGFIILADISGYTRFTRYHAMAVMHAEQIISDLLDAIIASARNPLRVVKLEGDAVFFYAESDVSPGEIARDLGQQALQFMDAFLKKEQQLVSCPVCICEACRQAGNLRLKIIMHYGDATIRTIGQHQELSGADVELARALLKNHLPASEYIMVTDSLAAIAGRLSTEHDSEAYTESLENHGRVKTLVYYPTGKRAARETYQPLKLNWFQRLRQYLRVNRYAIMRWLHLRSGRSFTNLPR